MPIDKTFMTNLTDIILLLYYFAPMRAYHVSDRSHVF